MSKFKTKYSRIAGGYERNEKTGKIRATAKYGTFGRTHKREIITQYAKHYHYPISNFKNFNKMLKKQTGYTTTKEEVINLLGY